jgi:hypothetical protein
MRAGDSFSPHAARCGFPAPREVDQVANEHQVRERPDASGHRRDLRGPLGHFLVAHVADQLPVDVVRAHVDDRGRRRHHVRGDQPGASGGGDQHVGTPSVCADVRRAQVADRDRCVLSEQQQPERLADHVAAPDDDYVPAVERHVIPAQQLEHGKVAEVCEAVVIGTRYAGSAALAQAGRRVAVLDRATLASEILREAC